MENSITEIICIVDKSGSMETLKNETIDGLNNFIKSQQVEDTACNFSLVQFNQELSATIVRQPIKQVRLLHSQDYQPNGYTALYDALGTTLQKAVQTIFTLPKELKPNKVMVFIITDGLENASRRYTKATVQTLISKLTNNNGWEFEFYGANINSSAEAESIGVSRDKATNWDFNKFGVDIMVFEMSEKASAFRRGNY